MILSAPVDPTRPATCRDLLAFGTSVFGEMTALALERGAIAGGAPLEVLWPRLHCRERYNGDTTLGMPSAVKFTAD